MVLMFLVLRSIDVFVPNYSLDASARRAQDFSPPVAHHHGFASTGAQTIEVRIAPATTRSMVLAPSFEWPGEVPVIDLAPYYHR